MSDHADLLGGDAVPAATPAKRKPGRPPRQVAASQLPPSSAPTADQVAPPVVLASTTPAEAAQTSEPSEPGEISPELLAASEGFTGFRPSPNDDGSVSLEIAPVSPEYADALVKRPIIIGQTNRDYAYKRLLRAGKKL